MVLVCIYKKKEVKWALKNMLGPKNVCWKRTRGGCTPVSYWAWWFSLKGRPKCFVNNFLGFHFVCFRIRVQFERRRSPLLSSPSSSFLTMASDVSSPHLRLPGYHLHLLLPMIAQGDNKKVTILSTSSSCVFRVSGFVYILCFYPFWSWIICVCEVQQ